MTGAPIENSIWYPHHVLIRKNLENWSTKCERRTCLSFLWSLCIYIYVYIHMLDLCWKGWNGRFGPLPAFSKKLVAVMVESLLIPGLAYQFWVEMFNFSKIHLLLKEGYPSVQQSIRVTVKFIASWVWEKLKVPAQSSHLGCKTWGNVAQNGVLPKVDVRIETERRSVDPPILIQNRETRNNTHAQWEACPLEKSSPLHQLNSKNHALNPMVDDPRIEISQLLAGYLLSRSAHQRDPHLGNSFGTYKATTNLWHFMGNMMFKQTHKEI